MGNLKVNGKPWQPPRSFRTDQWDWPGSEDPAAEALHRAPSKAMAEEAARPDAVRRAAEAKQAAQILQRRKLPGKKEPKTN
jgi:hypothetical protein